jgi:hypothetical protein
MIKDAKIDAEKISIVSIKTLKGSIERFDKTPKEFTFDFETYTGVSREKKLIRLQLNVSIKTLEGNRLPINVAFYSHEFIFHVDNFDDFIEYDEGSNIAKISVDLGRTLASIGYSTARGIIHVRTQGTVLNGIILPVVDPIRLLQAVGEIRVQSTQVI